jgi:hypothetical protein
MTHADTARNHVATAPNIFAYAAREAVIHHDNTKLERMFPGVTFAHRPVGPEQWELVGTCRDGSVVIWTIGE